MTTFTAATIGVRPTPEVDARGHYTRQMALDARVLVWGVLLASFVVWAWWRLFRDDQYLDQPAWARWLYLVVVVAMVVGFGFVWLVTVP